MYNRVVVPLDGSELAEGALPEAIAFARLAGATVHLLRVVDTTWMVRYGLCVGAIEGEAVGGIVREERAVAGAYLGQMRTHLAPTGIPVTA